MHPTRRAVLRGGALLAVGGLAGCLGSVRAPRSDGGPAGGGGLPDGSGDDTRPRGTGGPGVSLVAVDEAPPIAVRPAVEVTRDTATAEHPPQLRVTLTNEGEEAVRVGEGREVRFEYVRDEEGHLMLLPAGGEYPAAADCWRLTDAVAVTKEYRVLDIGAGESVAALVDLYGAPGPDACLPVGEFRFEARYAVSADPEGIPDAVDGTTWGFSVSLE